MFAVLVATLKQVFPLLTLLLDIFHLFLFVIIHVLVLDVLLYLLIIEPVSDCSAFHVAKRDVVFEPLKTLRFDDLHLDGNQKVDEGFAPELPKGLLVLICVWIQVRLTFNNRHFVVLFKPDY